MWIDVFLLLVNGGKKATTRTKDQFAGGGGGGGVVSEEKGVWLGVHLGWRMGMRAVKGLRGPWQLWWLLQGVL